MGEHYEAYRLHAGLKGLPSYEVSGRAVIVKVSTEVIRVTASLQYQVFGSRPIVATRAGMPWVEQCLRRGGG